MDNKKEDYSYNAAYHTRRIADTLEAILQLIKQEQEEVKKYRKENNE